MTTTSVFLLILSASPARAATFAPVHVVDGDLWVELSDGAASAMERAGPSRLISKGTPHAFVRRIEDAAPGGRRVRVVAVDGSCDGQLGRESLLGIYEPGFEEEGPNPENARWVVAAKVSGCAGPFQVAVLDPDGETTVRPQGPEIEAAAEAVRSARRAIDSSRVLADARAEWRPVFGEAERTREGAFRVGDSVFAFADVVLDGGECGSTLLVRVVVRRDDRGRTWFVSPPQRLDADDPISMVADLDGDGAVEVVTRTMEGGIRVARPDGAALLVGGDVPFHGCSC